MIVVFARPAFPFIPAAFLMHQPLAVVLAAGMGTRMKSDLPKVLCPVRGRPMVEFVVDALHSAGIERMVVVIGHRGELVREQLAHHGSKLEFVVQAERLGTGHAVQQALPILQNQTGPVVILTGDSPLVQVSSLQKLLSHFAEHEPACLLGTLHKENPAGLGRIVRHPSGEFAGIVEEKDASDEQRRITEVNMSTYVFSGPDLVWSLGQLRNDNRQKEFYLTDCPGILKGAGKRVAALPVLAPCEALSVNTPDDLAAVEQAMQELGYPCVS